MNRLEQAFALKLEHERRYGKIFRWEFEPVRLKLAGKKCTYTPDFMVVRKSAQPEHVTLEGEPLSSIEFFEVKGKFIREDAAVKLKVAAGLYPFWRFILAKCIKGAWELKEIMAGKDDQ